MPDEIMPRRVAVTQPLPFTLIYKEGETVTFSLDKDSESFTGRVMTIQKEHGTGKEVNRIHVSVTVDGEPTLYVITEDDLEETENVSVHLPS